MRDGGETIKQEALICGAVKVAPVAGDAPRLKLLEDLTGVTDRATDFVQQTIEESQEAKRQSPHMRTNSTKRCTVGREG